ncbi:hypothetical protein MKX01_041208, partial [Papaver californicum]
LNYSLQNIDIICTNLFVILISFVIHIQTVRFKNELERNITIKLGYDNENIYKCEDDRCPRSMCYKAYKSGKEDTPSCNVPGFETAKMKLLRHHLTAVEIMRLQHLIILQNKVDLIQENVAINQQEVIQKFIQVCHL